MSDPSYKIKPIYGPATNSPPPPGHCDCHSAIDLQEYTQMAFCNRLPENINITDRNLRCEENNRAYMACLRKHDSLGHSTTMKGLYSLSSWLYVTACSPN